MGCPGVIVRVGASKASRKSGISCNSKIIYRLFAVVVYIHIKYVHVQFVLSCSVSGWLVGHKPWTTTHVTHPNLVTHFTVTHYTLPARKTLHMLCHNSDLSPPPGLASGDRVRVRVTVKFEVQCFCVGVVSRGLSRQLRQVRFTTVSSARSKPQQRFADARWRLQRNNCLC